MPPYPDRIPLEPDGFAEHLKRLEQIYTAMDQAYAEVASNYGFHCSGCEDNCCLTRFYHHTYLEFLYLQQGYQSLGRLQQIEIRDKAELVCSATREAEAKKDNHSPRLMCPLNFNGRCSLYDQRPMICRMHGLPHQLHRPDGSIIQGPGCADFEQRNGKNGTVSFDRTPFYHDMARLEKELRLLMRSDARIKMTVAEMILAI